MEFSKCLLLLWLFSSILSLATSMSRCPPGTMSVIEHVTRCNNNNPSMAFGPRCIMRPVQMCLPLQQKCSIVYRRQCNPSFNPRCIITPSRKCENVPLRSNVDHGCRRGAQVKTCDPAGHCQLVCFRSDPPRLAAKDSTKRPMKPVMVPKFRNRIPLANVIPLSQRSALSLMKLKSLRNRPMNYNPGKSMTVGNGLPMSRSFDSVLRRRLPKKPVNASDPKRGHTCTEGDCGCVERVVCSKKTMERCNVGTQSHTIEVCHSIRNRRCVPIHFPLDPVPESCHRKNITTCDTRHALVQLPAKHKSCTSVPKINCTRVLVNEGGSNTAMNCSQSNVQFCRVYNIIQTDLEEIETCSESEVISCFDEDDKDLMDCMDDTDILCKNELSMELVPNRCIEEKVNQCFTICGS